MKRLVSNGSTQEATRAAYANLIEIEIADQNPGAIDLAKEACDRLPGSDYLHFCYGRALTAQGQDSAAIEQFSLSLDAEPPEQLQRAAHLYKALCLIDLKNLEAADAELAGWFDLSVLAVNVRLKFLEAKSGARHAANWAIELVDEHRDDVGIQIAVAQFLRQRGLLNEAGPIFSRLLKLIVLPDLPTSEQALLWAQAAYYCGDWKACLVLDPDAISNELIKTDVRVIQAVALQELNRHADALALLEKLVAENPARHDIVEALAITCFHLGRPNRAIPHLERLAHASNATPHDRMNLAVLYALAGDVGASLREADACAKHRTISSSQPVT